MDLADLGRPPMRVHSKKSSIQTELAMSNVNVTLPGDSGQNPRRSFPCPLCGTQLELRESLRVKPYCVCNSCGIQVFFRGQKGISRLRKLLDEHERLTRTNLQSHFARENHPLLPSGLIGPARIIPARLVPLPNPGDR